MRQTIQFLVFLFLFGATAAAAENSPQDADWSVVKKWLTLHNSLKTLSADFTQTRALKTLRSPLVSKGRLWFSAPDSFRWEIGTPARTIVIKKEEAIDIIHPGKKRIERIKSATGEWRYGMMSFPSAKNLEDFQRQFEVLSIETQNGYCRIKMLPRNAQERRSLKAITMRIDARTFIPASLEIMTIEGSSIRNDFTEVQINPPLSPAIFNYDTTGFQIIDVQK